MKGYTHAEGVTGILIDAVNLALCGLDVQSPHVLPVLLQQGDKEVNGDVDVLHLNSSLVHYPTLNMRKSKAHTNCSVVWETFPTATPMQSTFFNWNLTVQRSSWTLLSKFSPWVMREGNLPALFKPGARRGIWRMMDSEARKASYFLAEIIINNYTANV